MPRYKITQSLIGAWNYVHNCWEGQEDAAMESFLTALRGEKEELTPEQMQNIQNGFDFEKLVTDIATGAFHPQYEFDGMTDPETCEETCREVYPKWYRPAAEFGALLRGAQFQVRIHRPITVRGMEFEIHGVLDALKEGVIYDIKFKNKSFGSSDIAGDWLDSPQHPFYFYLVPRQGSSCIWFPTETTSTSSSTSRRKPERPQTSFPNSWTSSRPHASWTSTRPTGRSHHERSDCMPRHAPNNGRWF